MRTCRTCGKSIEHKRAGALHCDDDCRARYGQGIRAKAPAPDTTAVSSGEPPQTDPVFSDLAAALSELVVASPRIDAKSAATARPAREPPEVHRPPMEHLREPDLDPSKLDKRLFELELRMNTYDAEQPWQDWYDDAKDLVEEAKKLVEGLKKADATLRERVERIEKQLAAPATRPNIGALVDEKLRQVRQEIDRVDQATATRQSVERLAEQVRALRGSGGGDGRLDSLTERATRVELRVEQIAKAHVGLRAQVEKVAVAMAGFAQELGDRFGIRGGG